MFLGTEGWRRRPSFQAAWSWTNDCDEGSVVSLRARQGWRDFVVSVGDFSERVDFGSERGEEGGGLEEAEESPGESLGGCAAMVD